MSEDRIFLPATVAILEGWCGPARFSDHQALCVVLAVGIGTHDRPWVELFHTGRCEAFRTSLGTVSLDLSRTEVRDRVLRVVSMPEEAHFGTGGANTIGWKPMSHEKGWVLEVNDPYGHARLNFGLDRVPALADLDPNDDTCLPDGSRLVDALALGEVARVVLAVE